jgi:hypothetical protein
MIKIFIFTIIFARQFFAIENLFKKTIEGVPPEMHNHCYEKHLAIKSKDFLQLFENKKIEIKYNDSFLKEFSNNKFKIQFYLSGNYLCNGVFTDEEFEFSSYLRDAIIIFPVLRLIKRDLNKDLCFLSIIKKIKYIIYKKEKLFKHQNPLGDDTDLIKINEIHRYSKDIDTDSDSEESFNNKKQENKTLDLFQSLIIFIYNNILSIFLKYDKEIK